jgi:hypothetical protein
VNGSVIMAVLTDDLPPSIRVGPHDIRFATLGVADAKINYGTFVPAEQEIRLQAEYPSGSMAVDTVLHELIHAVFSVGTVQVKQGEEHIVSVVATYLAQIIRDNPAFVSWLQTTVRR